MSTVSQPPSDQHTPQTTMTPPRRRFTPARIILLAILLCVVGGGALLARGTGLKTKLLELVGLQEPKVYEPGYVMGCKPADDAVAVKLDTFISAYFDLPTSALDESTLTPQNVTLTRSVDGQRINGTIATASRGDRLNFTPAEPLKPNTNYTFSVSDQVTDTRGIPVVPYSASFTTGGEPDPSLKFEQVRLTNTEGIGVTCLKIGPDGKLWAGADDGIIRRYPILEDGLLGEPDVIKTLQDACDGPRLLIGFCFDPSSTAENPVIWVTHGFYAFVDSPDLSGMVSRMSGPNLEKVEQIVTGLPRAVRDHVTMQPSIGPDGCVYFQQGSNSNFGEADSIWGMRPERLLSATVLRIDPAKLTPGKTIDAITPDAGGSYDPFAPDAPLTIYADGVRLAYDNVWHSNGHFYMPTNGGSAGGNTPAGEGVPGIRDVTVSEHDWLHRIEEGKYYGHPNALHKHFVLNGGNPTAGRDVAEVSQYPVGVKPDPDWVPAAFDFGNHVSPNGVIEYMSDVFDGKLKHRLIVCRYNNGSDLIALTLDETGNVSAAEVGIAGWTNLSAPLDLIENTTNGDIYVSEYGGQRITLIRPVR